MTLWGSCIQAWVRLFGSVLFLVYPTQHSLSSIDTYVSKHNRHIGLQRWILAQLLLWLAIPYEWTFVSPQEKLT